jgi:myo-inositol-1(or 4)-monophosphatase
VPRTATETIEQACIDVVSAVLDDYRPRLLDAALAGDRRERSNARHADNFLSDFDMALHDHYRTALAERLGGFVYLSEEAEPEVVGTDPDPQVAVLVDPLDTSELAVRGLHGYTHLLAYSITESRPIVAVVGDFYHHIDLYTGTTATPDNHPRASLRTRGGRLLPIHAPARRPSDRLLVTSYNMRPTERFVPLARQDGLMTFLSRGAEGPVPTSGPTGDHSRIGVDFGSVGFCHVATGATDAFVELTKGFALWDLLPGQVILEAAGGVVCDLTGEPLPWPTTAFANVETMQSAMSTRQHFVAAGNLEVAEAIAATLKT